MSLSAKIEQIMLKPRILVMLVLGFSAGIPLLMVFSTLSAWLKEAGVSRAEIGFASWVGLAYGFKYIWSPLVDKLKIPYFTNLLGRRRSWMLVSQIGVIIGIMGMANSDPKYTLTYSIIFAVVLSFCSATQDIVIDAFRIDSGEQDEQAIMAALYVYGYRAAMLLSGAGVLYLSDTGASYDYEAWRAAYTYMAITILPCTMFVLFFLKEPKIEIKEYESISDFINQAFIEPFADFFERYGKNFLILLGIAITFRISDILMSVMANPFYVKIGFSNIEIANASKVFGVIMTILGVFIGGYLVKIFGILKSLLISGFFQVFSNLLYVLLNYMGPELGYLFLTVAGENFSGGLGSAAFVAYLSSLCNRKYTGTQYALLSSIMGLARAILSSPSGYLVEYIGWSKFFIISTFLGFPSIIILFWMFKMFPLKDQKSMK